MRVKRNATKNKMGNTNTPEVKDYYKNDAAFNALRASLSNPNVDKIYTTYIGPIKSKTENKQLFIYAIVINSNIHSRYYFNGKKEMFHFINSINRPYIIDKRPVGGEFIRFVYNAPTAYPV